MWVGWVTVPLCHLQYIAVEVKVCHRSLQGGVGVTVKGLMYQNKLKPDDVIVE